MLDTTTNQTTQRLADGSWYLHVRTRDVAGKVNRIPVEEAKPAGEQGVYCGVSGPSNRTGEFDFGLVPGSP